MGHLDAASASLSPLPRHVNYWLRAVTALGFLSFASSLFLLGVLIYRIARWRMKQKQISQFIVLILNLAFADIQQSLAFLLNTEWLRLNEVAVGTRICWVQGWFVSTGDLASGIWCFAIGLHTLGSVILDYRLSARYFYGAVALLWAFVYTMAFIGIGLHPHDFYVRAGIWCWVNSEFSSIRLWTHYFWIFCFEFGVVITYTTILVILAQRLRSGYYSATEATRVKRVSKLMLVYPLVYVVCTIPLASARMASMANHPPSLGRLGLAGAMITSNGWLDALLYTLTRRTIIFTDEPPPNDTYMDTFSFWNHSDKRFGAATIIESTATAPGHHRRRTTRRRVASSPNGSTDDLFRAGTKDIKLVTTTAVVHEAVQEADLDELAGDHRRFHPTTPERRYSSDSTKSGTRPA